MNKEEIIEYCLTFKEHWNTIIVDEKVDKTLVKELIEQSYQLTK